MVEFWKILFFWIKMKRILSVFPKSYAMRWHLFLLFVSTVYVIYAWDTATDFRSGGFNGENMIFILWLSMWVLPVVDAISLMGIHIRSALSHSDTLNTDAQAFFADVLEYDEVTKKAKVQVLDQEGNPTGEIIDGVVMVEKINLA